MDPGATPCPDSTDSQFLDQQSPLGLDPEDGKSPVPGENRASISQESTKSGSSMQLNPKLKSVYPELYEHLKQSMLGQHPGLSREKLFQEVCRRRMLYRCPCGACHLDYSLHLLHSAIHDQKEPKKCAFCGVMFHTWTDFHKHMYSHNK